MAESEKNRGGFGRLLLVVVIGAVLAFVLSESLRAKALDLAFGAEEEFSYSPITDPVAPA